MLSETGEDLTQIEKNILRSLASAWVVTSLLACGQGPLGADQQSNLSLGTGPASANAFEVQAQIIIKNNCASCHTASSGPLNIYNLGDANHVVSTGLVVPGQPNQSTLYTAISGGVMPPSGALSASDQTVIQNWIIGMAPSATTTTVPKSGGTTTTLPGANITFTSIEKNIFSKYCVSCHSMQNPGGGYAFDSYDGVLKGVDKTNPANSRVYTATTSGAMPRGAAPLSAAEEDALLKWIQKGALNN